MASQQDLFETLDDILDHRILKSRYGIDVEFEEFVYRTVQDTEIILKLNADFESYVNDEKELNDKMNEFCKMAEADGRSPLMIVSNLSPAQNIIAELKVAENALEENFFDELEMIRNVQRETLKEKLASNVKALKKLEKKMDMKREEKSLKETLAQISIATVFRKYYHNIYDKLTEFQKNPKPFFDKKLENYDKIVKSFDHFTQLFPNPTVEDQESYDTFAHPIVEDMKSFALVATILCGQIQEENPWVVLDDTFWPPYIQLLKRANMIQFKEDDPRQIKLILR